MLMDRFVETGLGASVIRGLANFSDKSLFYLMSVWTGAACFGKVVGGPSKTAPQGGTGFNILRA